MNPCSDHTYVCSRLAVLEERATGHGDILRKIDHAVETLDERQRGLASRLSYWGGGLAVLVTVATILARVLL
jgi:hypothetical protein